MATDPLVSIIIPCYNAKRFVGEAVRSALEQTYSNREVIVVNDGSTDGSLEVLKSFGDAIRLQDGPNRGGCAARNRGLELARGELVQFHDADDILHPEKLARQVPRAVANRNQAIYCNYGFIDEAGRSVSANGACAPVSTQEDPVVFLLRNAGITTPGPLLWREDVVGVGGFREELACAQERDLHLRLACKGMIFCLLPEELLSIRRVAGSVSSNYVRVLDQHLKIVEQAHDWLEQNGDLTDERLRAIAGFLACDARSYLRFDEQEKALEYFKLAKRFHAVGGVDHAYRGWARLLYYLIGPVYTQRLADWSRSWR